MVALDRKREIPWTEPVTQRDWVDAALINAAMDVHADDPEFGYRLIADELHALGQSASENRVRRLCSQQRIYSAFAKKKGLRNKPGPAVHDDRVKRTFTAEAPGAGQGVCWWVR